MSHEHHKSVLRFTLEGKEFEWHEQYITGAELRKLGNIPVGQNIFLVVESPWEDEHIRDEDRVDLARTGIESFVVKEKHAHKIILTIETTKGKWHNAAFEKSLTVNELIQKVIKKFEFASDGNYKLKIKNHTDFLEGNKTLESYDLKDHSTLVFTDIGKGA